VVSEKALNGFIYSFRSKSLQNFMRFARNDTFCGSDLAVSLVTMCIIIIIIIRFRTVFSEFVMRHLRYGEPYWQLYIPHAHRVFIVVDVIA